MLSQTDSTADLQQVVAKTATSHGDVEGCDLAIEASSNIPHGIRSESPWLGPRNHVFEVETISAGRAKQVPVPLVDHDFDLVKHKLSALWQLHFHEARIQCLEQADNQRTGRCDISEMVTAAIDDLPSLLVDRGRHLQQSRGPCDGSSALMDVNRVKGPRGFQLHRPPWVSFALGRKDRPRAGTPVCSLACAETLIVAARGTLPSRLLACGVEQSRLLPAGVHLRLFHLDAPKEFAAPAHGLAEYCPP